MTTATSLTHPSASPNPARCHARSAWRVARGGTRTGRIRTVLLAAIPLASFLFGTNAARAADPSGDAGAGKSAFRTCQACHSAASGHNGVGPSLAGVVGRQSGTESGYNYSSAMKAAHITWTPTSLDRFLTNPQADVHGTKMFLSVSDANTRHNIITYLATLK
jgi:cytochrome c2